MVQSRWHWALAVLLALLAMPPTLAAIGVSQVATHASPQLDWLTRSQLIVALVLGLRFLSVATVVMMRAVGRSRAGVSTG